MYKKDFIYEDYPDPPISRAEIPSVIDGCVCVSVVQELAAGCVE